MTWARAIFFQLSIISNLNLMVGKYWSWYNCSASGCAHLSTAASTVWICACKSTDWWPAEGCSLQLQPPWRLRRTSSYARGQGTFLGGIFCYLNPEGFYWARLSTWWNPPLTLLNLAQKAPFLEDLKKKFSKVTGIKDILCMFPKYIIIHGFRSPLDQKMP